MRDRRIRFLPVAALALLCSGLIASGCSLLAPETVPDPIPAPPVAVTPAALTPSLQPSPYAQPTDAPPTSATAPSAPVQSPAESSPAATNSQPPTPTPQGGGGPSEHLFGENVTLTFWHQEDPDSLQGKLLSSMIQGFEESYPEITVESVYVSGSPSGLDANTHRESTENAPDCVEASPSQIAKMIAADAVVPLDTFMRNAGETWSAEAMQDIFPGFLAACRYPQYADTYYALPFAQHALGLLYNRDLLEEAGHAQLPTSWEEFETVCLDVAKQTGKPALVYDTSARLFEACLISRGGSVSIGDQGVATVDGQAGIETLSMLLRLRAAGAARPVASEESVARAFERRETPFAIGSTSLTLDLERILAAEGNVSDWGVALLPQSTEDSPGTLLYGLNIAICNTTEIKQEAAWLLMQYLSSPRQVAMWSIVGFLPSRASAAPYLDAHFERYPVAGQQYQEIAPYAYPAGNAACQDEIADYLEEAIVDALEGIQTPADALRRATASIERTLAARCP